MNWNDLWQSFLCGESGAVQAIFSALTFIVTILGTGYIALTFNQQKKINKSQYLLNDYALSMHKREIRPAFKVQPNGISADNTISYEFWLTNAIAKDILIYDIDNEGLKGIPSKHSYWEISDSEVDFTNQLATSDIWGKLLTLKEISYKDEDGRQYIQFIKYLDRKIWTTFPAARDNKR